MARNTPITQDIDVIKEFEELKLKQKLLIQSLQKKKDAQLAKHFEDMNSKLDFLVTIFKQAEGTEDNVDHFKPIMEKLDQIVQSNEERFKDLETQIKNVAKQQPIVEAKEEESTPKELPSTEKLDDKKDSPEGSLPELKEEIKSDSTDKKADTDAKDSEGKESGGPPPPGFTVDEEKKGDSKEGADAPAEDGEKKKKKWF